VQRLQCMHVQSVGEMLVAGSMHACMCIQEQTSTANVTS
jgi:hypothetical protein